MKAMRIFLLAGTAVGLLGTVPAFAAEAEVPAAWPLDEVRLRLDVGGESLLTLHEDGAGTTRFGLDPNHRDFPLRARRVRIETESVPRLPFGQPVHHPRLAEARLVWIDPVVDRMALLLRQVWETALALDGHDVVPHLVEAAEAALRSLDWPSATGTYLARTAPLPQQQAIWRLPELDLAQPVGLVGELVAGLVETGLAHAGEAGRRARLRGEALPLLGLAVAAGEPGERIADRIAHG